VIASSLDLPSPSRPTTHPISLWYYEQSEDELIIVLSGAPYFQASAIKDLTARDVLAFVTFPSYSLR
jgi:hypothetical protein